MNQPTKPPHTDSPTDQSPDPNTQQGVVELVTVLVAVTHLTARVLTVNQGNHLPSGLLTPIHHSLQAGVRDWVKKQTAQPMGYVEQLYTFVDTQRQNRHGLPVLYVSYLGLVNEANEQMLTLNASWQDWYDYFPWEDRRHNQEPTAILTALQAWATAGKDMTNAKTGTDEWRCVGDCPLIHGQKSRCYYAMNCFMRQGLWLNRPIRTHRLILLILASPCTTTTGEYWRQRWHGLEPKSNIAL